MSKQTALKGAFVCWVGLAFCLYSHHVFEFRDEIVEALKVVVETFNSMSFFGNIDPANPIDII